MIKPPQKQNTADGAPNTEAKEDFECGGEAGALMGQGAKLLAGAGAEPLERAEDSSARAGSSVPTIPPSGRPLSWFQRRRQKKADAYAAARDHGLRHALAIADELASELISGRISGEGLAAFVDVIVSAIHPHEFAPTLSPKECRRLKAELGSAIINHIRNNATSAAARQKGE